MNWKSLSQIILQRRCYALEWIIVLELIKNYRKISSHRLQHRNRQCSRKFQIRCNIVMICWDMWRDMNLFLFYFFLIHIQHLKTFEMYPRILRGRGREREKESRYHVVLVFTWVTMHVIATYSHEIQFWLRLIFFLKIHFLLWWFASLVWPIATHFIPNSSIMTFLKWDKQRRGILSWDIKFIFFRKWKLCVSLLFFLVGRKCFFFWSYLLKMIFC